MHKLLQMWGYDGLMEHCMKLRYFYKQRRDVISALARKHLNGERYNTPIRPRLMYDVKRLTELGDRSPECYRRSIFRLGIALLPFHAVRSTVQCSNMESEN